MSLRYSIAARLVVLLLVAALCACAPSRSVRVQPIDEAPGPSPATAPGSTTSATPGEYQVVRGDTLYGIAFRHSVDYRDLARINRISAPYTIYPGQRLKLGDRAVAAQARPEPARPRGASVSSTGAGLIAATEKSPPPSSSRSANPQTGQSASSRPTVTADSAAASSASSPTPAVVSVPKPVAAPVIASVPKPAAPLPKGPVRWQWPASGSLVSTFVAGDPTRQGIGIGGSNGQSVVAAGAGTVVYSGAGLIGYGELIIIKHSDEWLSAYGHNRKRLVAEGESVQAGQQVAEMGRSGASRDMLHFEIRRNGKPVDPRGLLPKR